MKDFTIYNSFTGKEWPLERLLQPGFYFGKGWIPLVEHLINDLFLLGWGGQLAQVKEKFGGLRFYADGLTPEMEKLINDAEKKSLRICEECGLEGRRMSDGWFKTLCSICESSWRRRKK